MRVRRGKARSVHELGYQVAERRRIKEQIEALDLEKREYNARIEVQKKTLEKRLDRFDHNIARFYFEEGSKYFKQRTKTIFTAFGRVGSKVTKRLVFHATLDEAIDSIVQSGRAREFLSIKLKEGALKKNPEFARLVGLEVVSGEELLISPPNSSAS